MRIVTPGSHEEWLPFDHAVAASFGEVPGERTPEQVARSLALKPMDMRVGVADGDEVLGGCFSYDLDLSLPGGGAVPVAGLAGVGIDPTKTGRGGLRMMMVEHLRRSKERGHAASTLLASETGLYGRFGYGRTTTLTSYEIDSGHSGFTADLGSTGSLEMITDVASIVDTLAAIYAAAAQTRAGATSRPPEWWSVVVGETDTWLGGGKQLGVIHRNAEGEPTGYLLYTVKQGPGWVTTSQVTVKELIAADLDAELALFRFAASVPLTRSVAWTQAPPDTAVAHHLADPRQLRKTDEHDLLWLRPLDVAQLLDSRTYLSDGSITLAIDDPLFEDQRGPWKLTVSGGIGVTEAAQGDSQEQIVTLTPAQLGMIVLGETRVLELAAAGVLEGDRATLAELDRLMLTERRPFNLSKF